MKLLLSLLAPLTLSVASHANGDAKVKVHFYGEAQCPFCRKFVTETWHEIWSDEELKSKIDYEFVPWGNAYFATEECGLSLIHI